MYPNGPTTDPELVKILPGQSVTFSATKFWHAGYTPGFPNGPRLYVLHTNHDVDDEMKDAIIEAAKSVHAYGGSVDSAQELS